MTWSIPNISSSGNINPASITSRSSAASTTIMFNPISPKPPKGMILTVRSSDTELRLPCRGSEVQAPRRACSEPRRRGRPALGVESHREATLGPCPLGQGNFKHLVHMVHEHELHAPLDVGRKFFDILVVPCRDHHRVDPHSSRRQ